MTTISASSNTGVVLSSPSYTNPVVINPDVTISAVGNGVGASTGSWTLQNAGTVEGTGTTGRGIYLSAGGSVTNAASALITGYMNGVRVIGGAATVVNDGSITATNFIGVELLLGGSVTNAASASITAGYHAVEIAGGTGTVVNDGIIAGTGTISRGVKLRSGGSVTNAASASITSAGRSAILIYGAAGTVFNDGSIVSTGTGSPADGIKMLSGSVTNAASAAIAGGNLGVYIYGGAGTVANAGSIVGSSGTAVALEAGQANLVVIDPGAVFVGTVSGGGTLATLELASGASSGTLTGLGSSYVGFGQVTVGAFASWLLAGANTVSSGQTLTDSGTLDVASSLSNSGSIAGGVTLEGGASLTNFAGGVIDNPSGIAVYSAGTSAEVSVINAGSIASGGGNDHRAVELRDGGFIYNAATGTINGLIGAGNAVYVTGGTASVVNAGLIIGGGTYVIGPGTYVAGALAAGGSVTLRAGGSVTNLSSGTISGTYDGVYITGGSGTVVNAGLIVSRDIDNGVHILNAAGTVTNTGTIEGAYAGIWMTGAATGTVTNSGMISGAYVGIYIAGEPGDVTNSGLIAATTQSAVALRDGGFVSNAATGTISSSQDVGVYITGAAGTVINAGSIASGGDNDRRAVELLDGGYVYNAATGTINGIAGAGNGVYVTGGTAAVVNAGRIFGGGAHAAVALDAGGFVTNQSGGTIIGGGSGVYITGGTGTVANTGQIFGVGTHVGVALDDGGFVTNQSGGTISGIVGVNGSNSPLAVVNAGVIAGNATASNGGGIRLGSGGGSVTNASSATISGYLGVAAGASMTVVNSGDIAGNPTAASASGVLLNPGGSVTNQSGGTITGERGVVGFTGAASTVTNSGDIGGSMTLASGRGVLLQGGGSVTNRSGATINGFDGVFGTLAAVSVVNAGTILGNPTASYSLVGNNFTPAGAGIFLDAGGSITNQSSASIIGYNGIYARGGALTVVNAGLIYAPGNFGILLQVGGSVTNELSGTIGGYSGIYSGYFEHPVLGSPRASIIAATVVNYGLISVAQTASGISGVNLLGGGTVVNHTFGTITGYWGINGNVEAGGPPLTVINAGLIAGNATATISTYAVGPNVYTISGAGVFLRDGGTVTNQSTGSISGFAAVYGGKFGSITVVNAGTISGAGDAVRFVADQTDRVVVDPGAVFNGTVDGGNAIGGGAVSTLELASGSSTGTLTGLGSKYIDFAQITIDAGAAWTLTGANTIVAGETLTELNGAILAITGTLMNDGAIIIDPSTLIAGGLIGTGSVTIDAGSTVTIDGAVSAGETIVFAGTNAVLNIGDSAGFAGTIEGQGLTDQVNMPRTLVWTGTQNTDFANAFNWDDLTTPANPASAPPDVLDTAEFLATGGTVTGTGAAAVLQFGSLGQWSLGSGAALTSKTGITVGNGMLAVGSGASIAGAGSVDVISGTDGLGASVAVSGADAAWTSAGNLIVGDGGLGSLAIEADGTVISNAGTIANQSGAAGSSANLTGTGSDWQVTGTLIVGNAAQGGLDIASGATVTAGALVAAAQSGGDGVITVAGTNSLLQLTGSLTLGSVGAGELSILSGATASALDLTIGGSPALSSGNVDVEGAGSELSIATGGALNIGVADGGGGVLTIGSDAILNFAGIPTENGHASFNNYGTVDPDGFEYTTASNGNAGLNLYDLYIGNIGAVQVSAGTSTWFTPMVLTGTSVADATNNIGNNGDVGEWQLSNDGTLVFNANTVDAGQAIVFEDATDTLVIGQVVNGGGAGISGVTPTVAAGALNLLQAGGFAAEIWGYQAGDQILLTNLVVNADSIVGGNTLELFGAGGALLGELTFFNKAGTRPLGTSGMDAAAAQMECFAAGTRLLTARGELAVEAIAVGERVRVLLGDAGDGAAGGGSERDGAAGDGLVEVIWVGRREVDCMGHAQPRKVWPVRVAAGAFGPGLPHSDLWLSPDHAVYVAEVLIPVKYLINGSSIVQVPVDSITYHHIELAAHDVVLAEGLPVESYLDIKDGRNYPDRSGAVRLYPDYTARMWEAFGCARLVVRGPELAAARALVAGCTGEHEAA